MAINLGNFGNSIQQVVERPTYQADMTISNALSQFGKMAGDMAIQEQRELDETEGTKRTAEYQVGATELLTKGTELLNSGEVKPEAFQEWYGGELKKLKADKLNGVRPALADRLTSAFDVADVQYGMKARDTQSGFVKNVQAANLMQTQEQLERLAITDPETAKKQWLTALNTVGTKLMTPQEIAQNWQTFQEKVTFNHLASQLESNNSIGGVAALENRLADPKFETGLSPEARLQLRNAAQSKRRELKAEADRARREQEAVNNDTARTYVDILGSGLPVSPKLRTEMVQFTANGGKAGKAVRQTLASYDLVRTQQLKPLGVQGADLATLRSQVVSEANPERRAELQGRFEVLSQSYSRAVQDFKTDPLVAYQARSDDPLPPLDISSTQAFLGSLKQRSGYATRASAMIGKPVDLMTNAEAEAFTPMFQKMPVAAQSDILKSVRAVGGDRAAMSLAGALSKQDPVLGFAAYHAAKGGITTSGRSTSQLILQGKQSQVKLPDATRKSIFALAENKIGQAFKGDSATFNLYAQTAQTIYAGLAERNGDFDGAYDKSMAESALSIAMGNKVITFNDAPVLPPIGRSPENFEQSMKLGIRNIGAKVYGLKGETLDQFVDSTQLRAAPNDTYDLINGETGASYAYPLGAKYNGPIRLRGDK